MTSRRPLVGLTCYVERAQWTVWDQPAVLLPLGYVRAVEEAGGRPVLLPPSGEGAEETLAALDGLVLAGGADIDPSLYGARRDPATTGIRPDRDRAEMALVARALEREMPVLGVCRGMQMLNVCRGGDLVQHLGDGDAGRLHRRAPGRFSRHEVAIRRDSRLGRILGDRALVPSHHHQAVGALGEGLEAAAWAEDGTIEALEDPGRELVLGILWHPEEGEDRMIFEALVAAARR
jgi:putative glutamine amidotransferase